MNHLLVGLDASPRAPEVLAAAVRLASKTGARLTLVRAVSLPLELPPAAYAMPPDQVGPLLERDARNQLAALAATTVPPALEPSLLVELGTPWQVVCDAARRIKADLIVIGSHGYGMIDRVLGSTATKIVNHAGCSVLVVRAADRLT